MRNKPGWRSSQGDWISDVDFGVGILGKLRKGGTFEVVQSEVAPKDWEVSLLDVDISGRALFFYSIGEQQHDLPSRPALVNRNEVMMPNPRIPPRDWPLFSGSRKPGTGYWTVPTLSM
jgi:hypothetical protein